MGRQKMPSPRVILGTYFSQLSGALLSSGSMNGLDVRVVSCLEVCSDSVLLLLFGQQYTQWPKSRK